VFRGNCEGDEPVRAQEEEHRVGKSIEGQVCPVLQGGAGLDPQEGEAAARVLPQEGPLIWDVAVVGGGLHRLCQPGCGRVDLRGGAKYSEGRQTALVGQK